jgi:hypothetical protein
MNPAPSQCHEFPWPSALRHCPAMRSPPSDLAAEAPGEPCSSRPPPASASHLPPPRKLSPYPPVQSRNHLRENSNPRSLRRRASQGSLPSKPSAVSRFLSNKNVPLNIPDVGPLRVAADSPGPSKGDYYSTLPPTPPDDEEHVAWNPRSGMLHVEAQMSRGPAPAPVDEGPNSQAASGTSPDQIGSPGAFSNPSSASTSQDSAMDCGRDSWLENGIEAVGRSACPHVECPF